MTPPTPFDAPRQSPTTASARLRWLTLAFAVALTLVWIGAGIWIPRHAPHIDVASLHGIGLFFIVPALFFAATGLWVRLALGLAGFAAFIYVSALIASQIANY